RRASTEATYSRPQRSGSMQIAGIALSILTVGFVGLGAGCGGGKGGADAQAAPTCAAYCSSITANCTGANLQYSSMDSCMAVCPAFALGTASAQAGNSLGCRTYHAGAAAMNPGVHCGHAGPGGNSACGLNCEGFCTIVLHACTGANAQYGGNMGQCM